MDRNNAVQVVIIVMHASLSARRAWIEIPAGCWRDSRRASLSARRAWIEMFLDLARSWFTAVALRKESVDRNPKVGSIMRAVTGRSPQGERG